MTARLVVNPNLAVSKQLLAAVRKQLEALADLRRVVAEQDMMVNGEVAPGVGAQAASEYGLGTAQAGQDVWTLCSQALAAIDVPAVHALAKLDQG